jgi:hypothetical protein
MQFRYGKEVHLGLSSADTRKGEEGKWFRPDPCCKEGGNSNKWSYYVVSKPTTIEEALRLVTCKRCLTRVEAFSNSQKEGKVKLVDGTYVWKGLK